MPKAASRIEYGAIDKDGKNAVTVFSPGDEVKGLPADVMKSLADSGAIPPAVPAEKEKA
jgi:hypothetical protein